MPDLTFACESCGTELEVSDEFVGQVVECPNCSTQLEVPAPTAAEPVAEEEVAAAPAPAAPGMRKCPHCAQDISVRAVRCPHCNRSLLHSQTPRRTQTTQTAQAGQIPQGPPTTCGMAIASLICGLIPLTCIPSLLAIIFGHIALSKINDSRGQLKGRGMAIAGLILGYLLTGLNIIFGLVAAAN